VKLILLLLLLLLLKVWLHYLDYHTKASAGMQ
jgi:hypothetical protein